MARDFFAEQPHRRAQGKWSEDVACNWLAAQGYQILAHNFTTKAGEIDIIARDRDVLCFIEVKARTSDRYGAAIAAINQQKQRRLARAAALYLARHPTPLACRFDVLGMDREAAGWRFTLVKDAFMVEPR